jgi:hypothetical protein
MKLTRIERTLLAFVTVWICIIGGLSAAPLLHGEVITFCFQPSFSDGTMIRLTRMPDGGVHCLAYALPILIGGGNKDHSKARPKLLKEIAVSAVDFDALVQEVEAKGLRTECETSEPVGMDGTSWVFRHDFGGRALELRFWSPEIRKGSQAYALGARFAAVAQVKGALPEESQDPHGNIPRVVPTPEFKIDITPPSTPATVTPLDGPPVTPPSPAPQ